MEFGGKKKYVVHESFTPAKDGLMSPAPVIQTHDLSVYYGAHRGIRDLNLSVQKGEIFGFLGPNGAGKTTTLRALLDIVHPTQGRAALFGLDSQKDGVAIRERVSYLP